MGAGASLSSSPDSESTARLLATTLGKVRLYGAVPAIIKALADTGVRIVIGAANGDIPLLASDPGTAARWVGSNILPFCPASSIKLVTEASDVGDSGGDEGDGGRRRGRGETRRKPAGWLQRSGKATRNRQFDFGFGSVFNTPSDHAQSM